MHTVSVWEIKQLHFAEIRRVLLTSPITLKEHDHLCKSRVCAVSNIPAGNQLPCSGDWILRGRKKFRWLHGNPSTWSMQSTWHFKEKSLNSACEQGHSVSWWASTENLLSVSILYPFSPIKVLSEIPTSEMAIKTRTCILSDDFIENAEITKILHLHFLSYSFSDISHSSFLHPASLFPLLLAV